VKKLISILILLALLPVCFAETVKVFPSKIYMGDIGWDFNSPPDFETAVTSVDELDLAKLREVDGNTLDYIGGTNINYMFEFDLSNYNDYSIISTNIVANSTFRIGSCGSPDIAKHSYFSRLWNGKKWNVNNNVYGNPTSARINNTYMITFKNEFVDDKAIAVFYISHSMADYKKEEYYCKNFLNESLTMYNISISKNGFSSQFLVISVGDTVRWTNKDNVPRKVVSELFDYVIAPSQSVEYTFNDPINLFTYRNEAIPEDGHIMILNSSCPPIPPAMGMVDQFYLEVNITPFEIDDSVILSPCESTTPLDIDGRDRKYLLCAIKVDGEELTEKPILMSTKYCPSEPLEYTFQDGGDIVYEAIITYRDAHYDNTIKGFVWDDYGYSNTCTKTYDVEVPEPGEDFFNSVFDGLFDWFCTILGIFC